MVTVSSAFTKSPFSFTKFRHMQPVSLQLNLIFASAYNSGSCTAPHHTTPQIGHYPEVLSLHKTDYKRNAATGVVMGLIRYVISLCDL